MKEADIEDDYNDWMSEHFDDYYFAVVMSVDSDFYAVAYEFGDRAAYAIKIENPYEEGDEN